MCPLLWECFALTNLYVCPYAGNSCEVADAIADRCLGSSAGHGRRPSVPTRLVAAFGHVTDGLACARCRVADAQIDGLFGTRLGKHERNILLYSPGPEAQAGAILDPELSTHADRETYLRAVRKLSRVGLIVASKRVVRLQTSGVRKDGTMITRGYAHRTLRQTELGALVTELYREDLEAGRSIRWARHIETIRARYRWSLEQLVMYFAAYIDEALAALAAEPAKEAAGARRAAVVLRPIADALREP